MKIDFWKMHGAGNDFIMVDNRDGAFPQSDTAWLQSVGTRKTGVGCDGFILIEESDSADFRMRFYNPDGGEVEMCGNGARCVSRLAHDIGVAPSSMRFDTIAGVLSAEIHGDVVELHMTDPVDWRLNGTVDVCGQSLPYGFVNSGVPHVVVQVDGVGDWDVHEFGSAIRYHGDFAPAGTNANFIELIGENQLRIRTYERGVEGETLACGTGMVASALIAAKDGLVSSPVKLTCASGDELEVGFNLTDSGAEEVALLGPAVYVCTGQLTYSG